MKACDKLRKLTKEVESKLGTNKDLEFLKEEIPNQIEKRTRLGKGVDSGKALVKLKPLESEEYIEKRKKSPLFNETSPKRSNLTFTGEMLGSIKGTRSGTLFTFFFKGRRPDGKTNEEIAKYARENGRPFFDLSTSERVGLSRKISKVIKESIKKLFDK